MIPPRARHARAWASALVILSVLALTAPCAAQPGTEERARVLFDDAARLLRSGQFADARDLLNQALAIAPNPAIAFNLAVAYRGTGEALRSEAMLDAMLRGDHGRIDGAQRREVSALLTEVRADIGTLVIVATGAPEVELRIDGRLAGRALEGEPLEARADPGERVIVASAPDRVTEEQRVRVARAGRAEVAIALRPTAEALVGTLILEATDPSLTVEIVGVARALGRLERVLEPGRYEVRVASGGSERRSFVEIGPRSTTRFRLEDPRSSIVDDPAFWVVGSLGVLAAAAIVVGVVFAVGPPRESPVQDPVFGVVVALGDGP